jgi:N utilization substance protein B
LSARTKARKRAVDALFAANVRDADAIEMLSMAKQQAAGQQNQDEIFGYAQILVQGVLAHLAEIDTYLEAYSEAWPVDRMANLDRAILRAATWEIIYSDEVPDVVAISEAVELAKELCSDDSPKFINGLLGKISETKRVL